MKMPKPVVDVLYVGPFVLDSVLMRKAQTWTNRLEETYQLRIRLHIAEPPYQAQDVECRGYWLRD